MDPFGDSVCDVRILDVPLGELQEKILKEAGFVLCDEVPKNEPYLLISDRVWCTVPLLERLQESTRCLRPSRSSNRRRQFG